MGELLTTPAQAALIVLRTVVVYAFIMVGFRLTGKREVGQLAPFDFALVLLIANAVQNAMVGPDTSLVGGLTAAAVLLLVNWGLGKLARNNRGFERLLRGHARVLVSRGRVVEEGLQAENLTHHDLMQALRENGCPSVEDCRLAVMEVDGTISVIPANHAANGRGKP
ncbi:MAG TPA: YetF domain-containing protein [Vicinamibacteria bacterium]|nr:YetF domain-containing protein [Vicinamibacteria bacterium]